MPNLRVFISYATEDEAIADEFCKQLKEVFGINGMLHLTFAPQFSLGIDWRPTIEDELDKADILLVIATGQYKPSHSFTGFEVGFFRNSCRLRRKMTDFDQQDRLVLPVAIFAELPQPVVEIHGLKIDPMVVGRANLKDRDRFVAAMRGQKVNSLARVFTRIRGILQTKNEFSDVDLDQLNRGIEEGVGVLYDTIFAQLLRRESEKTFPERRIVFRLPQSCRGPRGCTDWRDATIQFSFDDQFFTAFGFGAIPRGEIGWPAFLDKFTDEQVRASWREAITTLVRDALNNELTENRQLITLPDRSRAFGMFVARGIQYLSGLDEFEIHLVEIGSGRHGNYEMTRLVEALSIGLRYRYMFLEGQRSSYSVEKFKVAMLPTFKNRVSWMVRDLDKLVWQSKTAGLYEDEFLAQIHDYMPDGGDDFDTKLVLWDRAKAMLDAAARAVLDAATDEALAREKTQFVAVLRGFCTQTAAMNREFIAAVFAVLGGVVAASADRWGFAGGAQPGAAVPGVTLSRDPMTTRSFEALDSASADLWHDDDAKPSRSRHKTPAPDWVPPVPPVPRGTRNGGLRNGHRKPT
ncbi:toll/interleukin-1 receptor domain-containing protein [Rhodoplanes sp. SY1]|uniref:toll/interleukin-1 receptor domain-containing protein n=1 Tax=Rhodoplanes sp. SY1 TaxID=3166646 RepID=UPI0038B43A71